MKIPSFFLFVDSRFPSYGAKKRSAVLRGVLLLALLITGWAQPLVDARYEWSGKRPPFESIALIQPSSSLPEKAFQTLRRWWPEMEVVARYTNDKGRHDASQECLDALLGSKSFVWAVRGGWGSSQLWDVLHANAAVLKRKIVVGFSDVTFLHLFADTMGWPSLHATMPIMLLSNHHPLNYPLLHDIFCRRKGTLRYSGIRALNDVAAKGGPIRNSSIMGGNLSLLSVSIGTPWQIRTHDRIVFIEEVDEKDCKIKRTLTHLKQAGVFHGAKAVLFGSFTPRSADIQAVLEQFARELAIPVFQCDLFGHGYTQHPLPLGSPASLVRDGSGVGFSLTVDYDYSQDSQGHGVTDRAPFPDGQSSDNPRDNPRDNPK